MGITALRVQRNYEQPEQVSVFLQVQNFSDRSRSRRISRSSSTIGCKRVQRDARWSPARSICRPRRRRTIAAPEAVAGTAPPGSRVPLSFEFALDRAAVVRAQIVRDDALSADNAGYVIVPPPRKLRVLLVTGQQGRVLPGQRAVRVCRWSR